MTDGDDHILTGDEVFVFHLDCVDEFRPTRCRELLTHRHHLVFDNRLHTRAVGEDVEEVLDLHGELLELIPDFIPAECCQALQAEIEDGFCLHLRQLEHALVRQFVTRIRDEPNERCEILRRPLSRHQFFTRNSWVRSIADQLHDFVDIRHRDRHAAEDMGAVTRFTEFELRPPGDDLFAELDKAHEDRTKRHLLRAAAIERQHVHTERGLERALLVEIVEDHIGHRIALELDNHADALAIALITEIGDAFDLLLTDKKSDFLDHRCFVHLKGNFGDDDGVAVFADLLDRGPPAHDDRATAGQQA